MRDLHVARPGSMVAEGYIKTVVKRCVCAGRRKQWRREESGTIYSIVVILPHSITSCIKGRSSCYGGQTEISYSERGPGLFSTSPLLVFELSCVKAGEKQTVKNAVVKFEMNQFAVGEWSSVFIWSLFICLICGWMETGTEVLRCLWWNHGHRCG